MVGPPRDIPPLAFVDSPLAFEPGPKGDSRLAFEPGPR